MQYSVIIDKRDLLVPGAILTTEQNGKTVKIMATESKNLNNHYYFYKNIDDSGVYVTVPLENIVGTLELGVIQFLVKYKIPFSVGEYFSYDD